jgi:diguanylate cyclase (GGDEF)-like protein
MSEPGNTEEPSIKRRNGAAVHTFNKVIKSLEGSNVVMHEELKNKEEENIRDPLTGAFNRRYLDRKLEELAQSGDTFAVLLIDIDHFKGFNDKYGHDVGDLALKHLVRVVGDITRQIRPSGSEDFFARYGGEEFVLVLRGIGNLNEAGRIAEGVRVKVENAKFKGSNNDELDMTFSGGVAINKTGELQDALLKRADRAMYEAKEAGRNRIVLAETNNV